MTPIKQGTARRLGLKRPEPVFEFTLSGPDVFDNGGDPLWHDIQRQLRAGIKQVVIDPGALEAHVTKRGEDFRRQAQPFIEALTKQQRFGDVGRINWLMPERPASETMRLAGFEEMQ